MKCVAARMRIRQEFRQPSKYLPTTTSRRKPKQQEPTTEDRIKFAHQVSHILRHNIVQGEQITSTNNNSVPVYRLKIDPNRHEIGDNESRFKSKSQKLADPCGCTDCVETV